MGNATQVSAEEVGDPGQQLKEQRPGTSAPSTDDGSGGIGRLSDVSRCSCIAPDEKARAAAGAARAQALLAGCFRVGGPPEEQFSGPVEVQIARPTGRSSADAGASDRAGSMLGVSEVDRMRYYREWDSLRGALAGGDTVLIRGSWIQQRHAAGQSLPRRQDLPPEGAWSAEELCADIADPARQTPRILALSYAWLGRDHPDANGFHLSIFAPLLQHYARHYEIGTENVAVFIDWCSLPQRPWSDADAKAHRRAMRTIDLWYAHTLTDVWLLSAVPADAVPYTDRGWTRFESAAATLLHDAQSVLDLGRLPEKWQSWAEVIEHCGCQRQPPQLPETFTQELDAKSFAYPGDRKVVADKYWGVFQRAISCSEHLSYRGVAWADAEVRILAAALPQCSALRELDLRDNDVGARGGLLLARVLPHCQALETVKLSGNAIGEVVQRELRTAWNAARRPEAGLMLQDQRPPRTTDEQDRASAQAIDRAERMAVAATTSTTSPGDSPTNASKAAGRSDRRAVTIAAGVAGGGKRPAAGARARGSGDNQQASYTALLARQAAFEARVNSALAKFADMAVNEPGSDGSPVRPQASQRQPSLTRAQLEQEVAAIKRTSFDM